MIGIAVFSLGVLAVLGMGVWAFSLLGPERETGPALTGRGVPAAEEVYVPAQDQESLAGIDAAAPPASAAAFQGVWEAPFTGGQSAAIAFQNGQYQIVLALDPRSPVRYYAQGTYSYDPATGIAVLEPARTLPPAPAGLTYEPLTRREYKILPTLNPATGRLFLRPAVIGGAGDQVHPLFFHVDSGRGPTGWTRRGAAQQAEEAP